MKHRVLVPADVARDRQPLLRAGGVERPVGELGGRVAQVVPRRVEEGVRDVGCPPRPATALRAFHEIPQCGGRGRRETDVSDTYLDSAWYHLRYPSTEFHDRPFDPARTKTWLPVSSYIGGNEHAVLHLLYSRFVCMVLADLGHLHFDTPYPRFRAHGLIVKDGAKMSKSRGNVVVPDTYIQQWGADTFRMYLMFLGPFQEGGDFRDSGIVGQRRFLEKV